MKKMNRICLLMVALTAMTMGGCKTSDTDGITEEGVGIGLKVAKIFVEYMESREDKDQASKPPVPSVDNRPAQASTELSPYDVGKYSDGRLRYLFRGKMEKLPSNFQVIFRGKQLYEVHRVGARWEGPRNRKGPREPLLKNSHGRVNSITLLVPGSLGGPSKKSDALLKF